jgi:predicted RecB family nuclease
LRFIESLLSNIPSEGSILCYNAFGAEALRLNELGRQFPQYQEALDGVVARMVDLAQLFTDGVVYLSSMRGAYSLKSVIQAIDPSLNYDQLSISHGLEAVSHYRNLANLDDEADVRDALLKYCKMDTLAMVEVLAWLKSLVKEDSHA